MEMKFRTIGETELEDFDTECRAYGLDPNEFNLSEHDYIQTLSSNPPIFHPNAKVTVTRNNVFRTYFTGNATHWVADFSKDLRSGIYD